MAQPTTPAPTQPEAAPAVPDVASEPAPGELGPEPDVTVPLDVPADPELTEPPAELGPLPSTLDPLKDLSPELLGEVYTVAVEMLISRRWPDKPLTPTERDAMSRAAGQLIQFYSRGRIPPEVALWLSLAIATGTAVGGRYIQERMMREEERNTPAPSVVAVTSPVTPPVAPTGPGLSSLDG